MGLVLVVLEALVGGWDLFADPFGWLLVAVGAQRLAVGTAHPALLPGLAVVAGLVSLVLWVPALAEPVQRLDESLRWVLDLPTPLFVLALARTLAGAAERGSDPAARGWWGLVSVGAVATALLPPVVYGAGVGSLASVAVGVAVATLLTCLVLCFVHAGRSWVGEDLPSRR